MFERDGLIFRLPEMADLDAFYEMRNNHKATSSLGGYSPGMSRSVAAEWIAERGRPARDLIYFIEDAATRTLVGHVGLYQIDHRIRSAEFAILIGNTDYWGRGVGRASTAFALEYGFQQLNLNRIQLEVLTSNERAVRLYRKLGFVEEGIRRQAQYKGGRYHDVMIMALLRPEYQSGQTA